MLFCRGEHGAGGSDSRYHRDVSAPRHAGTGRLQQHRRQEDHLILLATDRVTTEYNSSSKLWVHNYYISILVLDGSNSTDDRKITSYSWQQIG